MIQIWLFLQASIIRKLAQPDLKEVSLTVALAKMNIYSQILILQLAALVAATPLECSKIATVTVTLGATNTIPASTAITSTPETKNPATDSSNKYMTIAVTNIYGNHLSLSFGSNAGGPTPVGNPSPTTLSDNAFTQFAFPTGWAGRVYMGPNLNPDGSKIEGSFTGPPDIDVSCVDGYSVPITCSSEGVAVTGCNIDLFEQPSISCNDQVDGPVCLNPAQNIANGPARLSSQHVLGRLILIPTTMTLMLVA